MTKNKELELYFHIPFCVQKCLYCDFLSGSRDENTKKAYMEAMLKEIEGRATEYNDYIVTTMFIGGGTPSVIDALCIEKLLKKVEEYFSVAEDAEITIEVNPGTVDYEKLRCYRKAGINRLSIGLQSAKDEELKTLGRIHTFKQFLDTYENAVKAGFTNINVDVMSSLPGQGLSDYMETLKKVVELQPMPTHISAYSLIVEEGTPFAKLEEEGKLYVPDEECEREMYWQTEMLLKQAGYEHYEISNYARPGFSCKHNCGYWKRTDYVGFGIGAASLVDNTRFSNTVSMEEYIASPMDARGELQKLKKEEQMEEFMFLGLRLLGGVSKQEFQECFDVSLEEVYSKVISKNINEGLLECNDSDFLILTKKGIDISNYVMAQFLF